MGLNIEKGSAPINLTFDIGGLDVNEFNSIVNNPSTNQASNITSTGENITPPASDTLNSDITIAFKVDGIPAIPTTPSDSLASPASNTPSTTGIMDAVNLDHLVGSGPTIQIENAEDLIIKIDTTGKADDDGSDLVIPITPKEEITETIENEIPSTEIPKKTDDDILFSLIN